MANEPEEKMSVELKSIAQHVKEYEAMEREWDTSDMDEKFRGWIHSIRSNGIAYGEQQERQRCAKIHAEKLRNIIKELQAYIMPEFDDRIIEILQSLCSKLEGAAQAIEEGK